MPHHENAARLAIARVAAFETAAAATVLVPALWGQDCSERCRKAGELLDSGIGFAGRVGNEIVAAACLSEQPGFFRLDAIAVVESRRGAGLGRGFVMLIKRFVCIWPPSAG